MGFDLNDNWRFDQPRNCAVLTLRQVLDGTEPILLVSHDLGDDGWQFIGSSDASFVDARVVSLEEMVNLDPTILVVSDLLPGLQAVRSGPGLAWRRRLRPA